MALKVLMLRKKLSDLQKSLEELRTKDTEFKTREAELETAIAEASTEEEKKVVEAEVEKFETEKEAHDSEKSGIEAEIGKLENELETAETAQNTENRSKSANDSVTEKRKVRKDMNTRKFFGMSIEQRDRFFERDDVKDFLQRTRDLGKQKRSVNGAELLIPTVVLDLIKENIEKYSKLIKHINLKQVPGKSRQTVMGTIPEAIWTEACGRLNELDLTFADVEVDGYKVGGFIAICNATLEDSDIALATEIITALGQAIGLGADKAVLYGTGTKMPLGIVTRLVQTTDPGDSTNTITWKNLSTTNVLAITGKTDAALFKALVEATGAAKSKYSRGGKFWAMNDTTYTKLVANALSINAAGAITAGINREMPVIGGAIEVLSFIPDNVIIGGYGDLYLLAERAGASIASSEHARFTEDQTVFKGTARYDGMPVIAEGFVAIGIAGTAPSATAVSFATDAANTTTTTTTTTTETTEE